MLVRPAMKRLFCLQAKKCLIVTIYMLEIVTKVIGWIIQVFPIFIILRPRPRTYASTSPLLLLQPHQQQQMLSINKNNSTNHHLQHAKLRILLQHLTSRMQPTSEAAGRQSGPPRSALVYIYVHEYFPVQQQWRRTLEASGSAGTAEL